MRKNRAWQDRVLNKYIAKNFLKVFLNVLMSLSGIIFLIAFIEKIKVANLASKILFLNILYDLPGQLGLLLPFSVLISAMIVIYKLEKTSELTIIRGVGISIWQFIFPLFFIATIIGIIYTTAINPISVYLKHINKELERTYKISSTEINLKYTKQGLWLREQSKSSEAFIYAEEIKQIENYLNAKNIIIFELNKNKQFTKRIESKYGNIRDNLIEMSDVTVLIPAEKKQTFSNYRYPTQLSLQKLTENFDLPEAISFWNLPKMIKFFNSSGFPIRNYQITYYKLLFLPLSLISMVIFGAIFSLSTNTRDVKSPLRILSGMALGFIVYFLNQVFITFGMSGVLPILVSTISIPIITILISTLSLLITEDG